AFRLLCLAADGWGEASEIASWPLRQAAPEGIAEEIEAGLLEVSPAVRVFAVHDPRLPGMQLQAQGPEPLGDGGPQLAGLVLAIAVSDNIIRIALKRAAREFPVHPRVERVVGSPRGVSPRGSHGTERDRLRSFRSSHPLHRYARIHAQCAKSSGSLAVSPRHQALNRFHVRSRLYFLRAHRIK